MSDTCETFRDCRSTIPLSFLKFQTCIPLATCGFYGSDLGMLKIGCVNYASFFLNQVTYTLNCRMLGVDVAYKLVGK